MRERIRRSGWVAVLVVGLGLYFLVLHTLVHTQNPNFVPALILLGAAVVPSAFLTFAQARTGRWQVPASVLVVTAFFGGVIGVVVAGTLEYDALRDLGTLPMVVVALIEESAKLIVPVVLLCVLAVRHGRRLPSDGLVIGIASGLGFAALETMGYAFTALLSSNGNIGAVEETLFIRGLSAPAAHTAWTGLTCGALWMMASAPSVRHLFVFLGTFAGAVALHAAWDTFGNVWAYLVLAVLSLGWLLLMLRHYRAFGAEPASTSRS
ncbi:RsiW-degrading membrane proteinase PrsW (M82 family) [Actinoplanes tereljensis]|uniref:Protease PrsW n=1 Tax=Paractinoplanes tereljensis TaxID=571912 RepID=A0A919NU45_9ACTN|nr:PrsW family glutamic-type intramembrane protease [Actinoplanes tereljensis]GIF23807.1 protease PrsW [Actinoplanes tereljensis]